LRCALRLGSHQFPSLILYKRDRGEAWCCRAQTAITQQNLRGEQIRGAVFLVLLVGACEMESKLTEDVGPLAAAASSFPLLVYDYKHGVLP